MCSPVQDFQNVMVFESSLSFLRPSNTITLILFSVENGLQAVDSKVNLSLYKPWSRVAAELQLLIFLTSELEVLSYHLHSSTALPSEKVLLLYLLYPKTMRQVKPDDRARCFVQHVNPLLKPRFFYRPAGRPVLYQRMYQGYLLPRLWLHKTGSK